MLKYLTKIAMDILPSVVATVIGAYIVNHYINAKPAADAPAAASSTADPRDPKGVRGVEAVSLPEPGVKAKGISEKGLIEKTASERPSDVKPVETKADGKAAEAATGSTEPRRHPLLPQVGPFARDRAAAAEKTEKAKAAAPLQPAPVAAVPAVTPVPSSNGTSSTDPATTATEEHRDAAELARAAIDRLRGLTDKGLEKPQGKPQEAAQERAQDRAPEKAQNQDGPRSVELSRVQDGPRSAATVPVRPLPPPIMVTPPPVDQSVSAQSPRSASVGGDDPGRLVPPAEIPSRPAPPPLDLRADAGASTASPIPRDHARNVAEDMLSAAKSVFHAVIPGVSPDPSRFAD